jgi:hypothetical protein
MSNTKLFLFLTFILLILVVEAVREIYEAGAYAGLGIGMILVPMMFVLSLMIGIACGLRKKP